MLSRKLSTIILIQLLVFFAFSLTQLNAQEKKELTVEWIYSKERRQVTDMPDYFWLEDGTAILYDSQKPQKERTLEKFYPETGKRETIVDTDAALDGLNLELGGDTISYLKFPKELTKDGKYVLYQFDRDLFLLEIKKSKFIRVTETKEKEKAARFSPDGEKLAFVRANDLYVYDIKNEKEIRLTRDGSETILNGTLSWVYWEEIFGRHDIGYWWSEDSKAIAFLQFDESMVGVMHYVDFKPDLPRVITQRYPKSGTENPKVKVGIVEVNNPNPTWVKIDTASYEYIVRVKWLPDNQRVSVQTLNRMQTQLDVYFANRQTGKAEHIFTETNEGWVQLNDDLHFLSDGKHFLWVSERTGYSHLYKYTLDGELVKQLTSGEWSLRASSGSGQRLDRTVSAVDEKDGWIYFTALKKSSIERHLYRVRMDGSELQRISQGNGTHRIGFSENNHYYFDNYSNATTPPVFNLHKADGSKLKTVATSETDVINKLDLQYPEFFTIKAEDGFPMPASILKPQNFDPNKKYPIIFNIYGGPGSPTVRNSWGYGIYFDNILLNNGFIVMRVDNRSASGIAKKYENLIVGKMMNGVELQDLLDGVKWAKSQTFCDSNRIGVWGWSGGGMHTLLAMTGSDAFKAGISVAPVTDWDYYDTKDRKSVV